MKIWNYNNFLRGQVGKHDYAQLKMPQRADFALNLPMQKGLRQFNYSFAPGKWHFYTWDNMMNFSSLHLGVESGGPWLVADGGSPNA